MTGSGLHSMMLPLVLGLNCYNPAIQAKKILRRQEKSDSAAFFISCLTIHG